MAAATEEPPTLGVTLSPSGSNGVVGTPLTLTATVVDGTAPVVGATVHFVGRLEGDDDVDVTLTTDDDGTASHTYTRETPGTELLEVTATVGEESVSDETSFVWEEPPPVVEIDLTPLESGGLAGGSVDFVATVTADGEPLADQWVYFEAWLDSEPYPDEPMSGLSDDEGVVTFHHDRDGYGQGVDSIRVWTYDQDQTRSAETTYTWRGPLVVTMSAGDGSAAAGTSVEWTATVSSRPPIRIDGASAEPAAWQEEVSVRFLARMDGQPDVEVTLTPDADGVVTYTHTRPVVGIELLEVTATSGEESVSDEANFFWLDPSEVVEIDLSPHESGGLAGESVDFVARVTVGGEPLVEQRVYFQAWFSGNESPDEPMSRVSDDEGVVTFHLDRDGYGQGVDTIRVWTSALDQTRSAETTYTWRGPLLVTMSAGDGSAPAGTSVEWTATVSAQPPIRIDGASAAPAAWQEEVSVRFLARMNGQPDVDVTLTPGPDGVVTFTHTRPVVGTELLEVTATSGEESVSDEANFVWEEPPPEVAISVEPLDSSAQVGVSTEFAATVTAGGEPLPGELVDFFAVMQGTDDFVSVESVTDDDGVARFTHSRDYAGIDDVIVSTSALGQDRSAETIFTWRGPLEVTLSAGTGSAEVGTPQVVTATVSSQPPTAIEGAPARPAAWEQGVSVRFLAQMPGEPDVDVTLTTNADGVATYTHTRQVVGAERLLVEATVGEETASATGSFEWEAPPPVVALDVAPRDAAGPVDKPVEFLATLTADGWPVPNETVSFRARLEGQEEPDVLRAETDASGVARFQHVRSETGDDLIEVSAAPFEQDVLAETTYTWTPPVPVIFLTQSATSAEVGTPVELTATLTLGDEAVPRAAVRFLARQGGQPDVDVTVQTGVDGVATYTHTRTTTGSEQLMVGATVQRQTVFDSGSLEWTEVMPADVQIQIEPVDAAGPVGETVEFVATLSADAEPVAEQSVDFTAVMLGAGTVTLEGETDAAGVARFSHSRDLAGVDDITVRSVALDQDVSAGTTFTWQPPPPAPALSLTQSGTTGQVGTTLTWTATLTDGGEPVPGASIRFVGQLAGADDEDVTLTTGADGTATHSHSRSLAGTESLRVTAVASGLSATGAFDWAPGTPPTTPPEITAPPGLVPTVPPTPPPTTPEPTAPPSTPEPTTPEPTTPEPTAPPTTSEPTAPPTAPGELTEVVLERDSTRPGGDLAVSGTGCEPGSTVVISLEGRELATTTADADGAFSARGAVASMPLGKYAVDVQCGEAQGQTSVDLVSTSESSVAAASAASAAAVLTFFVLLGSSVFRSTFGSIG